MAYQAWLDREEGGHPQRMHLEVAAAKGSQYAIAKLDGPDYPDCLSYLLLWAHEVVGRSGVGMSGLAPLTPTTIRDWAALTDRTVHPHEAQALFALDRVLRNPPETDPTLTDD